MNRRHRPDLDVQCAVEGCRNFHDERYPMCRDHWLGLPSYMRSEVNRAEGTDGYASVVAHAIRSAGEGSADQPSLDLRDDNDQGGQR